MMAFTGAGQVCFVIMCVTLQVSDYWRMVIEINDYQKNRFVERVIKSMFNTVSKKKIAVSKSPTAFADAIVMLVNQSSTPPVLVGHVLE